MNAVNLIPSKSLSLLVVEKKVLTQLGKSWRMYTPPYVLLLIRTFLTLEGIAAKVVSLSERERRERRRRRRKYHCVYTRKCVCVLLFYI